MYLIQHWLTTTSQSNLKLKWLRWLGPSLDLGLEVTLGASIVLFNHFCANARFQTVKLCSIALSRVNNRWFLNWWLFANLIIRVDKVKLSELNHHILINILLFEAALCRPVLELQPKSDFKIVIIKFDGRWFFEIRKISIFVLICDGSTFSRVNYLQL